MNTPLLLGLLAQVFAACGFMYRGQFSGLVNTNDQCAPLCNFFSDICLPKWVDPNNQFPVHCVGDNDAMQAPARCVLCLKLNGVPPEHGQFTAISPASLYNVMPIYTPKEEPTYTSKEMPAFNPKEVPASKSDVIPDPCWSICNGYRGMCMPMKLDPDENFQPQCNGVNDPRHPSSWCFYCLVKHGFPSTLINQRKSGTINITSYGAAVGPTTTVLPPTSDTRTEIPQWMTTTVFDIIDYCSPKCNHYQDVCLPKLVDTENLFPSHCEDNKGVKQAPTICLICIKNRSVQSNGKSVIQTKPAKSLTGIENGLVYFCAPLCNYYYDICLPKWVSPENLLHTQCEDSSRVTRASVPCVLCLTHKEMPVTDSNEVSQYFCQDCADPCERVCEGYKHMCMPSKLDPLGHFQPHCNGVNDLEHPPSWCFYCLVKNGLPETLKNAPNMAIVNEPGRVVSPVQATEAPFQNTTAVPTLTTVSTTPIQMIQIKSTTTDHATSDSCAVLCNHYKDICLPRWVDAGNNFHSHCEDNKGIQRAGGRCLMCLKQNGVPATKATTIQTTTTPIPKASLDAIFEFCATLCNYYDDVCLPPWADPENLFHIHCEKSSEMKLASLPCVLCLKQQKVPEIDDSNHFSPTPCGNCDDPCEAVCDQYKDMCMPASLDVQGQFEPHCLTPDDYGQPSNWCFHCLVKHGLPGRFTKISTPSMTLAPDISTTVIQTTTKAPQRNENPISATLMTPTTGDLIDFCSPICNNYRDICLPKWADPRGHFPVHCNDISDPKRAAVRCLTCLKPGRTSPSQTAYTPDATTPMESVPTVDLSDNCAEPCNNYIDICLPSWADPGNHFPHRCQQRNDPKRPSTLCLMCLKNNGTLQSTTQPINLNQRTTTAKTTQLESVTTIINFCASLCNNYNEICLPKWADPEDQLHNHCEVNKLMKQASTPCVLCLQQKEVPEKESAEMVIPPCSGCADPCGSVCDHYSNMCIPAKQDPEGRFQPHCPSYNDNALPSSWCFYCLVKYGLPEALLGTSEKDQAPIARVTPSYQTTTNQPIVTNIQTSSPNQVAFTNYVEDECAALCSWYHDICLPPWVDPENNYHINCDDAKDVKRAPTDCLICLKRRRMPMLKAKIETTTKTTLTTNSAGIFEFCAPLCNNYNDICMPRSADPENRFYVHCESNGKMKRPGAPCVLCLQQNGVPPVGLISPPFCSSCADPCESVCNSYRDMCVSSKLDPEGHIQPHCRSAMSDLYPSALCFYCLVKRGLPERMTTVSPARQPLHYNNKKLVPTITDEMMDACAPLCNYYNDICLPKWVDPENQFHTHCEDSNDVSRPAIRCLVCIKEKRLPSNSKTDPGTDASFSKKPNATAEICAPLCEHYNAICLPKWVDVENLFQHHCEDSMDVRRASVQCLTCIFERRPQQNLFPSPGRPTSPTLTNTAESCAAFCNDYENICLPMWLDVDNQFHTHCVNNDDPKMPTVSCLTCIKEKRPPLNNLGNFHISPTSSPKQTNNVGDFCGPLCDYYNQICLPKWVDPRNVFHSQCDTGNLENRASIPCVRCLQQNRIPANTAVEASESICWECMDPCENLCDDYKDMCIPEKQDQLGHFRPHCNGSGDVLPPSGCFYCLIRHGLPDRLKYIQTATIGGTFAQPFLTTAMPMVPATSNDETDSCALSCNYYQDICLPKWVDPKKLFHTHCEDNKGVEKASVPCLVCLEQKKLPAFGTNTVQTTTENILYTLTAKKIEFCASLCNYYGEICLPRWMKNGNSLYTYCDSQNIEKRASVPCVLCLSQDNVPSSDSGEIAPAHCSDCVDPCVNICNNYRGMCSPAQFDPEGYFLPHCIGTEGDQPPSPWCFDCLVKHGVPNKFMRMPTNMIESTQIFDPNHQKIPNLNTKTESPAKSLGGTNNVTPDPTKTANQQTSAEPIGVTNNLFPNQQKTANTQPGININTPAYTIEGNNITPLPKKIEIQPTPPYLPENTNNFTPYPEITTNLQRTVYPAATTPSTEAAPDEDMFDSCAPVCNFYHNICLPKWVDPDNQYHTHCEDNRNLKRPTVRCIICIKQKRIPTTEDVDDENRMTPSFTSNSKHVLIEVCGPMCEYYNEVCIPEWADPNNFFKNHCAANTDVKRATVRCLVCLKQGGPFTTTVMPHFTTVEKNTPPQTQSTWMQTTGTTTMKMYHGFHIDKCRPICNDYVDICLPGWLDPWDFYSPHCEDVQNIGRPDVSCLLCLKTHCVTPTPPQSTQPYFTTSPKPYVGHSTVKPIQSWVRTATFKIPVESKTSQVHAPDECPGICSCTRIQTVITEVTTSFCPVTSFDDYECDLTDPSAESKSSDESSCSCVKDASCKEH